MKWNSTGGSVKVKQGSGILTLGTVKVEQSSRTVMVEKCWWKSYGGTVKWNSEVEH